MVRLDCESVLAGIRPLALEEYRFHIMADRARSAIAWKHINSVVAKKRKKSASQLTVHKNVQNNVQNCVSFLSQKNIHKNGC